ncbi:MAG: hypothetical protein ACE5OZ_14745 [Candidatus Heimdallarchaeota archaeon]
MIPKPKKTRKLLTVILIFISFSLQSSTNTISGGAAEWKSFELDPSDPTTPNSKIGGRYGFLAFEGDKDNEYTVELDLRITTTPTRFFGGAAALSVGIQDGDMVDNFQVDDVKTYNETGEYSIKVEKVVTVVLHTLEVVAVTGSFTGSYRVSSEKTKSPSLFSQENINLVATILGSIATIAAVSFAGYKYMGSLKFRKLVDQYLLNKEIGLKELVKGDEKKYLKMKKHLSDRGLLRESDM